MVEHHSFWGSRQVLRVAIACSTSAWIFTWDRSAACWTAESVSSALSRGPSRGRWRREGRLLWIMA